MAPDLGFDLKLSTTKIISRFSKEASSIQDDGKRIAKLEEYVTRLEEERRKIEVFKRELPLCMFLLDDVVGGMKDELEHCRSEKRHVLEEFMPINSKLDMDGGVKLEKDCKDKMNWMSSAQLWSDNCRDDNNSNNLNSRKNDSESEDESDHRQESETPSLESKSKSLGGAFVPFKGIPAAIFCSSRKEDKVTGGLPDLSLVPRPVSVFREDHRSVASKPIARCQVSPPVSSHVALQSQQQSQAQRKARRCWSPELHRRFIVALQQLGGAQVATPKQIRELMKVDGLTNDEVKSHLQKYRLHTQRVANRSVAVTGGLWPPQEHCTGSQQSASQSESPQGPLQLAGSSRAISVTAGDSCEEDGKSESFSWK